MKLLKKQKTFTPTTGNMAGKEMKYYELYLVLDSGYRIRITTQFSDDKKVLIASASDYFNE